MKQLLIIALVIVGPLSWIGCGEDAPPPPAAGSGAPAAAAPPPRAGAKKKGATSAAEPDDLPPLPVPDIQEKDFLESPTNRDPFRNFQDLFAIKVTTNVPTKNEKDVLVSKYALEELKIVGIVNGTAARVLISDPTGLGWVLRVGDYVGKAEYIHGSGTGDNSTPVNWRLDRIRENDVVFIRESPDPASPAATRVLSLRTQDELKQEIRTGIRGTRPDEQPVNPSGPLGPAPAPTGPEPAKKGG